MSTLSVECRCLAAHEHASVGNALPEYELLRAALAAGQFQPFYQPKIELATGRLLGLEILARWRRPGVGVLTPASFIAAMEQTPLIDALTESLLAQALRDLKDWRNGQLSLAVNMAPRTMENIELPERLLDLARRHGIAANRITLELTETAMAHKPHMVRDCAARLRQCGFNFAIDDFGTGYSSMALLLDLPFTELKIDRSFVSRLADSSKARTVLEAMISLGRRLGMHVVAEGVESEQESDLLRAIGCPAAQGFHFARPMSQDDLLAWLAHGFAEPITPIH